MLNLLFGFRVFSRFYYSGFCGAKGVMRVGAWSRPHGRKGGVRA